MNHLLDAFENMRVAKLYNEAAAKQQSTYIELVDAECEARKKRYAIEKNLHIFKKLNRIHSLGFEDLGMCSDFSKVLEKTPPVFQLHSEYEQLIAVIDEITPTKHEYAASQRVCETLKEIRFNAEKACKSHLEILRKLFNRVVWYTSSTEYGISYLPLRQSEMQYLETNLLEARKDALVYLTRSLSEVATQKGFVWVYEEDVALFVKKRIVRANVNYYGTDQLTGYMDFEDGSYCSIDRGFMSELDMIQVFPFVQGLNQMTAQLVYPKLNLPFAPEAYTRHRPSKKRRYVDPWPDVFPDAAPAAVV